MRFNVTGAERKALVAAVSGIVGREAVYMKAPSFAFTVNNYTIDRNGTLVFDERVDRGDVRSLLAGLAERGFVSEDSLEAEDANAEVPAGDAPDKLTIEVAADGFTGIALDNLEKLVASKASLIKAAVGSSDLPIVREDGRLCFPWFTLGASPEDVHAYTQFIHALCDMAKKQRRVTAREKSADSEKFAFRCFLLRLGFIGDEYASARKILLRNLSGSGSFKRQSRCAPCSIGPAYTPPRMYRYPL